MMIHTGIDERDYWYSAKAISQGSAVEYPYINHRTIRWAVILPVAAQQLITGTAPNAYYVMPILNSLAQTILLYLLGKRLYGRKTAVLACLCLIFFPYQIRSASQVRPEIFSITYILAMVLFFAYYVKAPAARRLFPLTVAAFMMFLAYEAKITNLFFMPGMFILAYLYRKKSWVKDSLVFGSIPLLLFIVETLLYARFTGYRFGHLEIISANHLEGMEGLSSLREIFNRYRSPYLQIYWQIPFAVFAALVVWTFVKHRTRELLLVIIPALSFFFFITFTVSSVHPLKMAEPFINRYFSAVLPLVFLIICRYIELFAGRPLRALAPATGAYTAPAVLAAAVLFAALFSLPLIPRQIRSIIRPPFAKDHPFALTVEYRAAINRAWKDGTPIVALDTNAGTNALYTASWYFIDRELYRDGRPPVPEAIVWPASATPLASLGGRLPATDQPVLALIRSPFRIQTIPANRLGELENEAFPQIPQGENK